MEEGHIKAGKHGEEERGEVQEHDADDQSKDHFVEGWRGSKNPRLVHDIHRGGDADGTEGGLEDDTVIHGFVHDRHGADGHAFEDGVEAHESCRVLRSSEHHDKGKHQTAHETNAHHGGDDHGVTGREGEDSRDERTQHRETQQVTYLAKAPIDGHSVGAR